MTWTFHLQPNVTWHDGTPFTADDVIFTLTLCDNPKVGCTYGGGISRHHRRGRREGRQGDRPSAACRAVIRRR